MKRILLQLLLITSLFGFASPIDKATALKVANTFRDNEIARKKNFQADHVTTSLVDITEKTPFKNFYIFSDEHCFVIVSADDCVKPILAYSTDNSFNAEDMPTHVKGWLLGYEAQIAWAKTRPASPAQEVRQAWEMLKNGKSLPTTREVVIGPLVQTRWDQNSPYNNLCPSGTPTGCVATAMAQIMKFWNYPEHGVGTHSYVHSTYGTLTADFGATTYRWSDMTNTYSSSSSAAAKEAVATLMYHCGVSVDMNYASGGSGAITALVSDALKNNFNYSTNIHYAQRSAVNDDDTWKGMLIADLDAGRPIQYHGKSSGGSHSFICDGYDTDGYFHFNWGWSGYYDGYYTIDHLEPGTGGTGAGHGIYNDDQGAVFGIEPPSSIIDAPLNLVAEYDNATAVLSWSASNGAASYNIYRNGLLLAHDITTTTYTDTHVPYGTTKYYVRAVDSNGFLSLTSNYAIVVRNYETPVVDDLTGTVSGRDVTLTWTAPEWCYPEEESATLTYGDGSFYGTLGFSTYNMNMYWGHRYPVSALGDYDKMSIYKVSFYANDIGDYKLYIYKDSETSSYTNTDAPKILAYEQSVTTSVTGWNEILLTSPFIIDASKDIWIFMYDPEIRDYPSTYSSYSDSDEGNYYSYYSPSYPYSPQHFVFHHSGAAFLIKTHITDGIYTYNIYRNSEMIASEQDGFTYTDHDLADGHYEYFLTTNYYKGESDTSNNVEFDIPEPITEYSVITEVYPPESGNVTGGGVFEANTNCTLTATAAENHYFTHFENSAVDGIITENPYTFAVTSDCTVKAYFASVEVDIINAPQSICSGEALSLTAPEVTGATQDSGWQISASNSFDSTTTYTNQTLDESYNGWWLRYWVLNDHLGYIYSNTVQISVNHVYVSESSQTACGSFEWNGQTYTDSQTLTFSGIGANGCDSIVTLELTVNHPQDITLEPVNACDSFEWNGQTYTDSQTLTFSGIGANGCDSIVTLELTINPTYEVNDLYAACHDELPFSWNGVLFTEAGTQSAQLESSNGCDSVVIMTLEVWNPQISVTGNLEIVQGESTTLTAHGCDFYNWSTGETTPSITVAPSETTTYSVTGTIFNGCAAYAEATVHVTEGINEKESLVIVYPNPVRNTLNVDAEGLISVRLVNKTGQIIHESKQSGSHVQIDMTPYASGHYFLQITTNNGVVTQKVAKGL